MDGRDAGRGCWSRQSCQGNPQQTGTQGKNKNFQEWWEKEDENKYKLKKPLNRKELYICQNEYVRDLYGNYVLDQFGRAILQQRCWYQ